MMKITQKELQKMEDEVMHNVTPWSNHTRMRKIQGCACVDCTIEVDLKELIDTTYTNEIHLFFDSPLLKNSTVKHASLRVFMGWVTFWEVSQKLCE